MMREVEEVVVGIGIVEGFVVLNFVVDSSWNVEEVVASFLEEKVNVVAFDLVEMEEESCLVGTEVASYQEEMEAFGLVGMEAFGLEEKDVASYQEETEVVEIQEEKEEASFQEEKERILNFDWVA